MNGIRKHSIMTGLLLLVVLGLTACGENNYLIGKWEGEKTVDRKPQSYTIEFTPHEVFGIRGKRA